MPGYDVAAGSTAELMEQRISPRSPRAALEPERVPMPTRRSAGARHPLVIAGNAVFTILILAMIVAGGGLLIGKERFDAPGPLAEDKIVNIPRGGIRDIGDQLKREGVIDQPWLFVGGVIALKVRGDLKFGEYEFAKHASLHDVITTITEGKVVQHPISIPEGLTSQQIVQRLADNDMLTGSVTEIPREGSLLPETYKFPRGTAREQVIKRMQDEQRKLVQYVWEHRMPDLPIKTPEDLVTLASLIEKETSKPEERTRVAAVFVNRLNKRMKLQSDPTIIYGLVGGKGRLDHSILESEKRQPTPYNTYVIDGLPPGPIANPGRASLEAAANPARTKELYFVADGNGGHVFSENYGEHQKNVDHLREVERQLHGDNAAAAAVAPPPAPVAQPAPATPAAQPAQPAGPPMRPASVKRSVKRKPAPAPQPQ
jgi:UPF0755 protein